MRPPTANKSNGQRGVNLEALNPRTRLLYERTGHFGPWSTSEFLSVVGVIEPSKEPETDPPPEVLKAMEQEDLATIAYDVADRGWQAAAANVLRIGGEMQVIQSTGRDQPILIDAEGREIGGREQRRIVAAQTAERQAWERRDLAGAALTRARIASQEAQRGWRSSLYANPRER